MIIVGAGIAAVGAALLMYGVVCGKANTCSCGQIMTICQAIGCAPAGKEVHEHHRVVRTL